MLNKIKKIKAFTLLELTIVVVIIGVLMAATMKFGWNRIWLLNNKNIQEQFLNHYSSLQSRNNMTNYYMWKIYQNLHINFELGENDFWYKYDSYESAYTGRTYVEWWNYKINVLSIDWKDIKSASVIMTPYSLWCMIGNDWNELNIWVLVNNSKQYCFSIQSDNCRMRNVSCKN